MLEKGKLIELKVEKIVFGGEGLGFYEKGAVFLPESVPGDVLQIEIISSNKSYSRGIIKKIIEKSKDRVEPFCDKFEDCGGCDFMMIDYKKQILYKKEMVKEVIERTAKINDFKIEETIPAPVEKYYRNKIIQPFGFENGKVISGFYKKRTHEIADNEECFIQSNISNKILKKIKEILNESSITFYDEKTQKGFLRNVMIRTNRKEEVMLVFVINSNSYKIRGFEDIIEKITKEFKEIKSVYFSLNTKFGNVIMGDRNIKIYGEDTISEKIFDVNFFISPNSFFQINPYQTENLYSKAIEMIENIENKVIVDAYSGTGTIGITLAKKAKYVYAVEIVKEAVNDGIKTAKGNNIVNIEFIIGKVEEKIDYILNKKNKIDCIVFDPPRKGIEKYVLEKIAGFGIQEIIYISCNASTFARDMEILKQKGYLLEKVQPVDMFPHTNHIEIVAKIKKGES